MCKIRVGLHRHGSQNCHNIFIYFIVSCLELSLGCFFVLIGNYYLPSQRKHKALEGKDA